MAFENHALSRGTEGETERESKRYLLLLLDKRIEVYYGFRSVRFVRVRAQHVK